MGDYSQTMIAIRLKNLTKQEVDVLEVMSGEKEVLDGEVPDHPFFALRWKWLFRNSAYYLPIHTGTALFQWDKISKDWEFAAIGGLKWSAEEEMNAFIDWLRPKIEATYSDGDKTFVGFTRYETQEVPTLYYIENNHDEE